MIATVFKFFKSEGKGLTEELLNRRKQKTDANSFCWNHLLICFLLFEAKKPESTPCAEFTVITKKFLLLPFAT